MLICLRTGSWKEVKFKNYNYNAFGVEPNGGHLHPLLKVRTMFREILLEMGFNEMPTNRFVECSFWNFDTFSNHKAILQEICMILSSWKSQPPVMISPQSMDKEWRIFMRKVDLDHLVINISGMWMKPKRTSWELTQQPLVHRCYML